MKVSDAIDILTECDPKAEVRIMCQPTYPFECAVDGLTVRQEFSEDECECDRLFTEPHEEGCPAGDEPEFGDAPSANDVFIVKGRQER